MAQVDIGKIKIVWKGPWNSGTAYTVDDAVSHSGSSYICIQAGTNQNPSTATAYWQQMAGKGTDADLINISGTAQGDIYYNNGSAIARLAPGVANQVLQTGGSGANPSWTTVSSDMVKLAQIDLSSNPAQGNSINGYFSSTYENYRLVLNGVHMASGNSGTRVGFYFMRSGSNLTGNNTYILMRNKVTASSQGWGESQEYSWDSTTLMRITQDNDNGDAYTISGTFDLFNVNETNRYAQIVGTLTSQNSGAGDFYSQIFAGRHNTTGAMSGIHIRSTADTLNGGSITLYGMK